VMEHISLDGVIKKAMPQGLNDIKKAIERA
jgi:hypothetical protein